ncbi:hypothetical protein P43SY_003655 [Pythium insidiosum]|uniref:EF-hand domain-containing protein n=1 Tax=Pythium insidiosum TaxID=114742 RepID=A0AAD5LD80_PYTIN|nr:hypothetical protein P43SY_003655 [Pythium insidiosum]
MGSTSSEDIEVAVLATPLSALTNKIAIISPHLCPLVPKQLLSKTKRQVTMVSMGASVGLSVTIRDVTTKSDGNSDVLFTVDGYHVLRDRDGIPLATLVGNQTSGAFDVRDANGEPTALATFQDRIFGKRYILGYTGDWTRNHLAVFWATAVSTPVVTMHKTHAKIESMSTAEWHQYHQLLQSRRLMTYFEDEIMRFAHSQLKPDDVLRRFSLNGDGQLDLKEFQLAVKRLGIIVFPPQDTAGMTDSHAMQRSKELFSAFCPSNNRKLDIDMFCRIMAEWSLQIMRTRQQQQQQEKHGHASRNVAPIPTPYAVEPSSMPLLNGVVNTEAETIWRRISESVIQHLDKLGQIFFKMDITSAGSHLDKLGQIFFKMDITSAGSVSQEEFELAMSHIGVFLTAREYERLYESLPLELKDLAMATSPSTSSASEPSVARFGIRYADFLAAIQRRHPQSGKSGAPTAVAHVASPPIATNARLWDLLVLSLDHLEPLVRQFEKAHQRFVSTETLRDILMRCGLAMSNQDFAALRVRLRSYTDANGCIDLSMLLQALQAHDRSAMASAVRSAAITSAPPQLSTSISPIRTGRKTVFPTARDPSPLRDGSQTAPMSMPAGKSNEQRNLEANRSMVRIRDESRWKSDLGLQPEPASPRRHQTPQSDSSETLKPNALEFRILAKLQQLKEVGQLGTSSAQTAFPGDRFGRITRGQFRQSLVHLGVLARYAEVEELFWTLDPNGRGYMVTQDLYEHLNTMATRSTAPSSPSRHHSSALPPLASDANRLHTTLATATLSGRLSRSVQKIFEGMLLNLSMLLSICERYDPQRTGLVSRAQLMAAIQEAGVLASQQDVQTAVTAMTQRVELPPSDSLNSSSAIPLAEPYHPSGIVYSKLETRLKQLCSDLLSPKKRRQHLTTASVLLAPEEEPVGAVHGKAEYNMNIANETDALWNCPRRKMNHDHPATKTSIQISDQIYDDPHPLDAPTEGSVSPQSSPRTAAGPSAFVRETMDKRQRGRRLAMISILQDLLERRGELKSVMDLHPHADVHGQVSKRDLLEILMASRLNLDFTAVSSASSVTVREFVDVLYPQADVTVSFLDLLHRISDLLTELTRVTPLQTTALYGNNAPGSRRLHSHPQPSPIVPHSVAVSSSLARDPFASAKASAALSFPSDALSLQRKLLFESRLQDLLTTEKGRQSAAVLIRHAFKGVMARELVVPIENGEYEAVCRASDLKYVCYRLGLDLDVGELHYLVAHIDVSRSGYISSPQLLAFLVHLATTRSSSPREPRAVESPTAAIYSSPVVEPSPWTTTPYTRAT